MFTLFFLGLINMYVVYFLLRVIFIYVFTEVNLVDIKYDLGMLDLFYCALAVSRP